MSDINIPGLPQAVAVNPADLMLAVQQRETRQSTIADFVAGLTNSIPATRGIRFSSGSDGDVTIAGNVTLSRDMYYNNLTIGPLGRLLTNGYKVFVSQTLDLTQAPANGIYRGLDNGSNGTGPTSGGAGGGSDPTATVGGGQAGGTGGNGQTGAGSVAGNVSAYNFGTGGRGGSGGAGGAGSSAAGGAQRVSNAPTNGLPFDRLFSDLLRGGTPILGGAGCPGGSGGGGDGVVAGGRGGGGGGGGGVIFLAARRILVGPGTAAGAISSIGGNGGNGTTRTTGTVGGGGGGGGAGGGWIYLYYEEIVGGPVVDLLNASGGNGGNGGDGTFAGGNGGDGGYGGRIDAYCITAAANYGIDNTAVAGATGAASVGLTGGTGGLGTSTKVTL